MKWPDLDGASAVQAATAIRDGGHPRRDVISSARRYRTIWRSEAARLPSRHRSEPNAERLRRFQEAAASATLVPGLGAGGAPHSVFDDDLIVYARTSGPRLPITSVAGLSRQLRRALMACAVQPVPEMLSGHLRDGSPSQTPHLAIVPLPEVVGHGARGAIIGVALILPRGATREQRHAVMRALVRLSAHARSGSDGRSMTLLLGHAGELTLRRCELGSSYAADASVLASRTWTRLSTRWVSATPVALDRHPGDLHGRDPSACASSMEAARASVAASVRHIGLPMPVEIDVIRTCVLPGGADPLLYRRFSAGDHAPQRKLVHVRLRFAERVRGPLLFGAGRYQGLGLCLPVDRHWRPSV